MVGHRIDSWQYRVPECNTIRCGTWWMRHTLGWSEQTGPLEVAGRADAYGVAPEFTGTLPEPSRLGYVLVCGAVRAGSVIDAFRDNPKVAGAPEITGTWPETATLGHSVRAEVDISAKEEREAQVYTAEPSQSGDRRCGMLQ